jgi:hypothetical protein
VASSSLKNEKRPPQAFGDDEKSDRCCDCVRGGGVARHLLAMIGTCTGGKQFPIANLLCVHLLCVFSRTEFRALFALLL